MIQQLDHTNSAVAKKIREVWQVSYVVEAELLKVKEFPPLERTLDEFINADTQFFGFWHKDELAAAMEIRSFDDSMLIQSLVVDPQFFRRGIGGKLVQFALENFNTKIFYVETGAANAPAILLYEKFGFLKIKEYFTEEGIRKVRFKKQI